MGGWEGEWVFEVSDEEGELRNENALEGAQSPAQNQSTQHHSREQRQQTVRSRSRMYMIIIFIGISVRR